MCVLLLSLWRTVWKKRVFFFLCLGLLVLYRLLAVDEQREVYERVKRLMGEEQDEVSRQLEGEQENIQKSAHPEVYSERLRTVEEVCRKLPGSTVAWNTYFNDAWFVESHKLVYCAVPKAGSTFWKRVLEILRRGTLNLTSPYRIPYEECVKGRLQFVKSVKKQKEGSGFKRREIFVQKYKKFLFVRDPFKRLFSAYIDKFFNPNKEFWKVAASFLSVKYPGRRFTGRKAGSDLSFSEFVEMVVGPEPFYGDPHFKPISQMSEICGIEYDVIGKMETFKTDVFHILSLANASNEITFADFEIESTVDFITEMIGKVFIYRKGLEDFMGFHDILLRVWERLKIANVLDVRDPFPLRRDMTDYLDVELFVKVVVERYFASYDRSRLNKKAAYLQAYRQLTREQMEAIRETYRLDFEMFGYNIGGPDLSVEPGIDSDMEYDYFHILSN